jgi:hypothetical protein
MGCWRGDRQGADGDSSRKMKRSREGGVLGMVGEDDDGVGCFFIVGSEALWRRRSVGEGQVGWRRGGSQQGLFRLIELATDRAAGNPKVSLRMVVQVSPTPKARSGQRKLAVLTRQ